MDGRCHPKYHPMGKSGGKKFCHCFSGGKKRRRNKERLGSAVFTDRKFQNLNKKTSSS